MHSYPRWRELLEMSKIYQTYQGTTWRKNDVLGLPGQPAKGVVLGSCLYMSMYEYVLSMRQSHLHPLPWVT